jgi:hypothetical protein
MLALLLSLTLMRTVEVRLAPVHFDILNATERFVDVEGALRSAKTWTVLFKLRRLVEDYPGIRVAIGRWTEDGLNQKLIPDWRNVCAVMGISHGQWNAAESCYDFPNGSRVYCIHLKTSQADNRYTKVRGLTVAVFYIDQLEEVPEDVYDEAALRLSQPGYPQQMVVSPNPVPESHWIAKRWNPKAMPADHRYLKLSIFDNKHNLSPETIHAAERLYPLGHPQRRVKIDGERGLDVRGTPVYLGAFKRSRHVALNGLDLNPDLPLCEAYDYGFHHPCVVWYQVAPWGWIRVLGGLMGEDLHLDAFLPVVERYRQEWFSQAERIEATCDPAGASENSQGLRGTPVGILRAWYQTNGIRDARGEFVVPRYRPDANHPERRYAANQLAATYMRRAVNGQEAFQVDAERWRLVSQTDERFDTWFVDGLEVGYVLEDDARHSNRLGTYSVAKKDGWFEHGQNCFEYGLQAHVYDLPTTTTDRAQLITTEHQARVQRDRDLAEQRALRLQQKDTDPDDTDRSVSGRGRGRPTLRKTYRRI